MRILDPDRQDITGKDAALAAVSLLDIEIRDGLVAWLCPGTLALDELSEDIQNLFSDLGKGVLQRRLARFQSIPLGSWRFREGWTLRGSPGIFGVPTA